MERSFRCCCAMALLFSLAVVTARADEPAKTAPDSGAEPPREKPDRGRMFGYGPRMWQAFSQLSDEERAALQKLQREDPAKFREVMAAKAEELYRKRQERTRELEELAAKCRDAKDAEEAKRLREKLTSEVEKDFREHLAANRRHLEEMKRRAKWMEKELDRREKNRADAVRVRVEAMIRGEKPPRPPHYPRHSGKFDGKPLEK